MKADQQLNDENMRALNERIKELKCLYNISSLIRNKETINELLQEAVNIIPEGWQHPEITSAKIQFENHEYISQNFKESKWRQSADIIIDSEKKGLIDVYYAEQRPKLDEGPFLKEERNLIQGISDLISETIVSKNTQSELLATNQQLRAANQQLQASEQQLRAANQQLSVTEQKLMESNRRFEKAQEMGQIANFEYDIAKKTYWVSDEGKRIYGYNVEIEEFSREDALKCIPDKERVQQAWVDLIEKDKPYNIEHEIRPVSGPASKIIKAIAEVVKDEAGNPIKVVGFIQDITKLKRAEEELLYNSYLLQNISDAIIATDLELRITSWNKNAENMYGWSKKEVLGKNLDQLLQTEFIDETQEEAQKELLANKNWQGLVRQKKKTGEALFINVHVSLLEDEQGNTIGGLAVNRNVTERIKVEEKLSKSKEKLKESEKRLRDAQRIANIGNWFYNLTTGEVQMSNQMYNLIGIDNEKDAQDVAQHEKYYTPASWQRFQKAIQKAIQKGKNYEIVVEFSDLNSEFRYAIARGEPVFDETNKIVAIKGTLQDITERKNYENKLIKAKKKAEESDRLKSAFLANMSHEIRTPMNGILGFTELLQTPDLREDTREKYIEIIHKSGDRMLNTVNDIIELSKIEAGLTKVKKSEIDMSVELKNLIDFFQPQAEQKNLMLSLKNEVTSLLIQTDKIKFESIITNLIRNAIKYTNKGKIEVSYGIKNGFIQFCVKDTGIGVPQNRKNAIFNRFEQADIEDKHVYEGSGLGLAISKSYVEMLGGKIWVESVQGKGSSFYFKIPYLYKTTKPDLKIKDKKTENNNKPLNQIKILIVEDDEVSADYLEIILNDFATNIIIANSGEKAIELIKVNPDIDIVLMDIKMPGISGIETTRIIREFNKEVIIIAQTAYSLSGDKEKVIAAGCNDYITKPVIKTELIGLITMHLCRRQ
ncbi:MAG TPA: PAS domain S-box protein [Flavobacteriaceae bacterium]|nr:PAS domain S-box protein [Flavobacteriaceae bacterium]